VTKAFPPIPVLLNKEERERVQKVADKFGMTFEEATEALSTGGISDRVKKRTGYRPAKVYPIKRNK
jgi:hypothetical protein